MKLPFVSRTAYELLTVENARLRAENARLLRAMMEASPSAAAQAFVRPSKEKPVPGVPQEPGANATWDEVLRYWEMTSDKEITKEPS